MTIPCRVTRALTMLALPLIILLALCERSLQAVLNSQSDTWNASFQLTSAQIAVANISTETAHNVEVALRYERTNNAGSLVQDDLFYNLPAGYNASDPPPPGTVLKVEQYTNITLYTIPMSLSMSRFLYMTETFNGTSAPASAFVLWPYLPRHFSNLSRSSNESTSNTPLYPIVGLPHGSIGQTQACAPSGLRNLWDEFHEPFPMALAGYAVVAPDYLGAGVPNVSTAYFIFPSQANDLFYAIEAAQKAWPDLLSKEFVLAGQSQGGGVAWSAAQRQAQRPVEGYLGTLAASPFTDTFAAIAADALTENNQRIVAIAHGLQSVLPGFELSEWLTDAGIARLQLLEDIQGCSTTATQLFSAEGETVPIVKDDWNLTDSAIWYKNVSSNGGKPFAGPMLVIQGTEDPNANEPATTKSVQETCQLYPDSQLQYIRWVSIFLRLIVLS